MATWNDEGVMSFAPNAAIPEYARVKLLSTGKIDVAGAADEDIGFACRAAAAQDVADETPIAVWLRSKPGTVKAIASEAANAGAIGYSAANGKVSDTAGTEATRRGIFITASAADGEAVEFLPLN